MEQIRIDGAGEDRGRYRSRGPNIAAVLRTGSFGNLAARRICRGPMGGGAQVPARDVGHK